MLTRTEALFQEIPFVVRPAVVFPLVVFASSIPYRYFFFSGMFTGIWLEMVLAIGTYFFVAPLIVAFSITFDDLKNAGAPRIIEALLLMCFTIPVGRIALLGVDGNEYVTPRALAATIIPLILTAMFTAMKYTTQPEDSEGSTPPGLLTEKDLRGDAPARWAPLKKIPCVIRPAGVFLLVVFASAIPYKYGDSYRYGNPIRVLFSTDVRPELWLIVCTYFLIAPVIVVVLTVRVEEMKNAGVLKVIEALLLMYVAISVSRLGLLGLEDNEYFTLRSLVVTIIPLILIIMLAGVKYISQHDDENEEPTPTRSTE